MASEDAVVAQGLECCLCFELFTEPKQLSCTHTFCKKCLDRLYECHLQPNQLSCPICRKVTNVNNGDISKLSPNIPIKSMVEDLRSAQRSCTVCGPEAKARAVQYCMQCDEYMCDACAMAHGKFKKTAKHDVVSVDDVKRGKVKVKRFCHQHPDEEKLYICTSCNVSICFRCRVLNHSNRDHVIKEVSDYKKTIKKQIESIQKAVNTKIATIKAHAGVVIEQKVVVEVELDKRMAEINQTYEEAVQHLTRQRNDLIDQCKQEKETLVAQLEHIRESDDKQMSSIRSASELVGNGIKTLLEGQSLSIHNKINYDLQKMLDESNPNDMQPKSIADRAKGFKFIRSATSNSLGDLKRVESIVNRAKRFTSDDHQCDSKQVYTISDLSMRVSSDESNVSQDMHDRRDLRQTYWMIEEVNTFPLSHADMWDAAPFSDGRVAVGYMTGKAIEIFTINGPQGTVLRSVQVRRVSVLSDDRYVVRDKINNITVYNQAGKRLGVQFNKPSGHESGGGGMCVDGDDNIYVGYCNLKKIYVFLPVGGGSLWEIPCHECIPWEICHMHHSKRLAVCYWSESVMVIDDRNGTVHHRVRVDGSGTHIAVLKDDSILIGYTKDGQLHIEYYTEDLKRIRTVLSGYQTGEAVFQFSKLVALPTEEIVVVSHNRFIVFRKI